MWLLDIFGKTCAVSVITVVLACDCDCVVSSSYTSVARYLSSMSSSSDAYIHTYMHTYIHTYLPFYIHTYLPTYIHTYIPTILPSRSFTISFVFPSFPVPAKTIEAHFRKKLTCGVIRSFNFRLSRPGWDSYLGIPANEPCPFQQLPRGWARVPRQGHLSGCRGGQRGCREALPPRRPREPGEEG